MFKLITLIQESAKELREKVSWPTYQELSKMVAFFFIGLAICTLLVGVNNVILQKAIQWLYVKF